MRTIQKSAKLANVLYDIRGPIMDAARQMEDEGQKIIKLNLGNLAVFGFDAPEEIQQGVEYMNQTKAAELLGDVNGAIAYLQGLPNVNAEAIGCIGFCFGGHVAYLAATLPAVKATASFYGAGITKGTPGGGEPTVTRTSEITGTLYAFFGKDDDSIPAEQVNEVEAALEANQVPHRVFQYAGAGHGFFCDRRGSYNPEAAAAAWEQVKALFTDTLAS